MPSRSRLHATRPVLFALTIGVGFYLGGQFCAALPRAEANVAPIWISNALALAALLRARTRHWPLIVAACFASNLMIGHSGLAQPGPALAYAIANAVEYLASAIVLRRLLGADVRMDRARDLVLLAVVATASTIVAAPVAAGLLALTRGDAIWPTLLTWTLGHPLSLLLVTPCVLVLSRWREHLAEARPTRIAPLSLAALAISTVLVFSQSGAPILFLIPPALLFVALELGVVGAAAGVLFAAVVAISATVANRGPIPLMKGGHLQHELLLQLFLVTALFSSIPVAALQSRERKVRRAAEDEADRATRAETAVAESEARYRLLADKASDIIVTSNLNGEFQYLSPSVTAVSGYASEELVGRVIAPYVHPDDVGEMRRAFVDLAQGLRETGRPIEYRLRRRDGAWVWLESNPQLVRDPQGAPVGFVDIARDVTARKAMEAELMLARREAEAAAAAKAEFLANMSHELRTPLTAVLGFAGLVAEQPELSAVSRRYLDRVRVAGKALLCTVNDVLDFSRLEGGQIELSLQPADPAALARETLELFESDAAAKGIALHLTAANLPARVCVDGDRVRQLLVNLLGNAVKFTMHGEVRLEADYAEGVLTFTVRDTGSGIAPAEQERLFQRFTQVDGSSTRVHGGSGLGLAICKGLVEAMGGTIWVRSTPGAGSCFGFRIPAASVQIAAPLAMATLAPSGMDGAHVLLVDDAAANREITAAVLRAMGVAVDPVPSGDVAIRCAALRVYDLVLMDLRMPGLDGATAARRIRAEGGLNARTPMIAFSADVLAAPDAAFDGVLAKPISPAALAAVLRLHVLDRRPVETADAA